jgi:hypothetical protein
MYTQSQNNTSYDLAPGARFGVDPLSVVNGWVKAFAFIITGHLKITDNLLPHTNFIPTFSSVAYTFPNNEPFSVNKSFIGVNLSKCAGTTPFDTVYAPAADLNHVQINEEIANWFKSEIFTPKPKSTCAGDCPDYLTLTTPLPNGAIENFAAKKAIIIPPKYEIKNGSVIKAQIACGNGIAVTIDKVNKFENQNTNLAATLTTCPFQWDITKSEVNCGVGFTNFKMGVKNIDVSTYTEFSTNGSSWFKATLGDKEYSLNLNANPGQPQTFYARPKNDPTNVITIALTHCN